MATIPGPARPLSQSYTSIPAAMQNRIRSARGHSSRPPARIGRIMTPGENHHTESRTAATPIATRLSASAKASRRFLVMNWRRTRPRARSTDDRAAGHSRPGKRENMMPELYRPPPGGQRQPGSHCPGMHCPGARCPARCQGLRAARVHAARVHAARPGRYSLANRRPLGYECPHG